MRWPLWGNPRSDYFVLVIIFLAKNSAAGDENRIPLGHSTILDLLTTKTNSGGNGPEGVYCSNFHCSFFAMSLRLIIAGTCEKNGTDRVVSKIWILYFCFCDFFVI
jgi:hypothetical protein